MKTIVVYQSGTGFTAKYASWIAEQLNCEAKEFKKVKGSELAGYDKVIFGGWIMANMIMGLSKMKDRLPDIVFAVGASPVTDEVIQTIREQNKLGDTPFFYYEGGINLEKLGLLQKGMIKMVKNSISKKDNKTEMDVVMEKALGSSHDHTRKEVIFSLVAACKQ